MLGPPRFAPPCAGLRWPGSRPDPWYARARAPSSRSARGTLTRPLPSPAPPPPGQVLTISDESPEHPSILVRNRLRSKETVRVGQTGVAGTGLAVEPGGEALVCWDEPHGAPTLEVWPEGGGAPRTVAVDHIGAEQAAGGGIAAAVSARGPTRVVTLRGAEDAARVEAGWLARADGGVVRRVVSCSLAGLGVSLLDGALAELVYLSLQSVRLTHALGPDDSCWEFKVGALQIDNQTPAGPAVVLQRAGGAADRAGAMAHVSAVRQHDPDVDWLRYLAASVQPLRVALHESLLVRLLGFAQVSARALHNPPCSEASPPSPVLNGHASSLNPY